MFGQKKLIEQFERYSLLSLPRTILFLGEEGCGKHTFTNYLSEKYNTEIIEIDKENVDDLVAIQQNVLAKFYRINLSTFTEKQQNQLLKFIEEPSQTCYIFLLAESSIGILPTIINRSFCVQFDQYTKEDLILNNFLPKNEKLSDLVYSICQTPGQLLTLDIKSVESLYELCTKLVTLLQQASVANTLSLITRINFKEEYDKFDNNLFFRMILYCAKEQYIKNKNETSLKVYLFTCKYIQSLQVKTINKENFTINYLLTLKRSI